MKNDYVSYRAEARFIRAYCYSMLCDLFGAVPYVDELTEMYDGIYVKDFILFFGEKVQYYILESQTADGQIGASGCLGNGDIMEEGSGDRYAWLNEMLLARTLDDREKLAGKMKRYYGMTKVTEEAYRHLGHYSGGTGQCMSRSFNGL